MALRWRISHERLLGIFLGVAILAQLGCVLWVLLSSYAMTNSLRSKLVELRAAEDLKAAVANLTAPQTLAELRRFPAVQNKTSQVHNRLNAYDFLLQHNNRRAEDAAADLLSQGMLEALNKSIAAFESAILADNGPLVTGPEKNEEDSETVTLLAAGLTSELAMPGACGILKTVEYLSVFEKMEKPVLREVRLLRSNAMDLQDLTFDQLQNHVNDSRRNYQVTLWIFGPAAGILGLLLMGGFFRSMLTRPKLTSALPQKAMA